MKVLVIICVLVAPALSQSPLNWDPAEAAANGVHWASGPAWNPVDKYQEAKDGNYVFPCSITGALVLQPPGDAQTVVIGAEIEKADGYTFLISDCPHSVGGGHAFEGGQPNPDGTAQIQVKGSKVMVFRSGHGHPEDKEPHFVIDSRSMFSADLESDSFSLEMEIGKAYLRLSINGQQVYENCECGLLKWMGNMYMGVNRAIKDIRTSPYTVGDGEDPRMGSGLCDVCIEWKSDGQKCAADNCFAGLPAYKIVPAKVVKPDYGDTCWSPSYGKPAGDPVDDSSIYSSREAVTAISVVSDLTGVYGLQLTYGDDKGPLNGPENTGDFLMSNIELEEGECIVKVKGEMVRGRASDFYFVSNFGNEFGPYGLESGDAEEDRNTFEYSVDLGNGLYGSLIAFKGTEDENGLISMRFGFECDQDQIDLLQSL